MRNYVSILQCKISMSHLQTAHDHFLYLSSSSIYSRDHSLCLWKAAGEHAQPTQISLQYENMSAENLQHLFLSYYPLPLEGYG